jgi:RNA ligase (TIGR02306 family)
MERKLASIRKISEILPIEGADAIELAIVDGWKVVVAKNVGHKAGDFVIYCEIDSFLPVREEYEFLRKSSYKRMGEQEGFRLKTIKLRGQVSQGLILPIAILKNYKEELKNYDLFRDEELNVIENAIGLDVSEVLGIIKYEPPMPAELKGVAKGNFPSFIQKTDEERVQNLKNNYYDLLAKTKKFFVTEKLDGSSATFYVKDGNFGVCSRNLELLEPTDGTVNSYWKVARDLDIENKLLSTGRNLCIQGELIGEGIQGNPYRLKGQTVKFFNAFDIDKQKRLSFAEFWELITTINLPIVPIINFGFFMLPSKVDELLAIAEGKSTIYPNAEREGLVLRTEDMEISFKVISNRFLLKEK